jgi:hypothetical protein
MRREKDDLNTIKSAIDFAVANSKSVAAFCKHLRGKGVLFFPSLINEKTRTVTGCYFYYNEKKFKAALLGKNYSLGKIIEALQLTQPLAEFSFLEDLFCEGLSSEQKDSNGRPFRHGVIINHMVTVLGEDIDVIYESNLDKENRYSFLVKSERPPFVKIKSINLPSRDISIEFFYGSHVSNKPSAVTFICGSEGEVERGEGCFGRIVKRKGSEIKSVILKYLSLEFDSEIIMSSRTKLSFNGDVLGTAITEMEIVAINNCQADIHAAS